MHRSPLLVTALITLAAAPAAASPEVRLVYETGPTYIAQNDGRYGEDGTSYDADTVGQQDNLVRGERRLQAARKIRIGRVEVGDALQSIRVCLGQARRRPRMNVS